MPAIDIARLKIQCATLVEKFDQPAHFLKDLREILDLYAERTLRVGLVAAPISVLPSYRTPPAVLRQIELEIAPLAATFPEQAMGITDALWKDGTLETRLLAASLMGKIHPQTPLLIERITAWVNRTQDQQLKTALLTIGLQRLRRESPADFLELARTWLASDNPKAWSNAIYALIPMLKDPEYENLPPVFEIVKKFISETPNTLQNELIDIVVALYAASAVETTYYMKQIIQACQKTSTLTIYRRILNNLPPGLQNALRETIRQKSEARQNLV